MVGLSADMAAGWKFIPHVSLSVDDEDIYSGARLVLGSIRRNWKPETIEFKLLTDGITNKLVACKPEGEDEAETVLVRVYGNKTDLLIDRKAETRNIKMLNKLGLAPSLYGTFENGLAYEFVPGNTLTDQTVTVPHIYRMVAKKMAQFHKVPFYNAYPPRPSVWFKLQDFLDLVPEVFSNEDVDSKYQKLKLSKVQIRREIVSLKEALCEEDSPLVFAHNDLLLGNVIYTEEKDCVTFIDFEYADLNYQAYDIANHFAEFAGVEEVDYSKYPSEELQMDWLAAYMLEFQGFTATDEQLHELRRQVDKFALACHIFWGVWALIQAEHSHIDFDFIEYANARFTQYFKTKDASLSPKCPE